MTFRRIVFLGAVAALFFASAAQAQVGVYAGVVGERLNGIACTDVRCADNAGTVRPYGGNFGAYYDWRTYGRVRVGADLRGSVLNGNKSADFYQGGTGVARHYSVLGGVRGTFRTHYNFLQPYAQMSVGMGRTNATYTPPVSGTPTVESYKNFTQVQGFAGIDLALAPAIDFRIIELGAGGLFGSSTHSVQSIGAGIVFHLPRGDR